MIVRGISSLAFIPLTNIPLPEWIKHGQKKLAQLNKTFADSSATHLLYNTHVT